MVSVENFSKYGITEDGQVWSYKRKIFLKQRLDKYGYLRVNLMDDDNQMKTMQVHKLVALAYVPNPDGKPTVNHNDECKTNNHYSNLTWMTNAEQNSYGTRMARIKKAISRPVRCIETGEVYESCSEAGRQTKAYPDSIAKCVAGKYKTAGGFHWERV